MYRIAKTLNHNSFIGVEEESNREYLVMGKDGFSGSPPALCKEPVT